MGGEGYALDRALSDTALAQLRSREKCARSDLPRRWPSDMYEFWWYGVKDCMEMTDQSVILLFNELELSLDNVQISKEVWLSCSVCSCTKLLHTTLYSCCIEVPGVRGVVGNKMTEPDL
jgi:hypothetical protein